jgi:hypothetical protein
MVNYDIQRNGTKKLTRLHPKDISWLIHYRITFISIISNSSSDFDCKKKVKSIIKRSLDIQTPNSRHPIHTHSVHMETPQFGVCSCRNCARIMLNNEFHSAEGNIYPPSSFGCMIDWLYVSLNNFTLICRRHHYRWRLQNLGLCSALRAFEQGGSLSCHTCCDTEPWFFRSHPMDRPIQSPFTTHKGMWRIYSIPGPHGYHMDVKFLCFKENLPALGDLP